MAEKASIVTPNEPPKKQRVRSPEHPFINLRDAIARAEQFYEAEQHRTANAKVAMAHWGYDPKSSGGMQTLSTLISFGLLEEQGSGDLRTVKLTPTALRIVIDDTDSPERLAAIQQAAMMPKIHRELRNKFGGPEPPSDRQFRHILLAEWEPRFNANAVENFIKEYRDTITFAKLTKTDTVTSEVEDKGENDRVRVPYVPKIGDYVQWEHNGVLGLPESRKIQRFTPDGMYAYLEGQHGAVPANELIPEAAPSGGDITPDPNAGQRIQSPLKTSTMQEFVVPLSDGSKAVFQWPSSLSKEDIDDLRDSLKIVERKITRSTTESSDKGQANATEA